MTTTGLRLLSAARDGAETLRNTVAACLGEATDRRPRQDAHRAVVIAGIGTTAPHALNGQLLRDALDHANIALQDTTAYPSPDALLADHRWDLALVLSPWKRQVSAQTDALTSSAHRTGVVDTLVRDHEGHTLGVNTNSWAAQAAMETVTGGQTPTAVLVLGSGGSAHSVALGCRRAWPHTRLVGSARNAADLAEWAASFDAETATPAAVPGFFTHSAPTLIVNTTTWGETEASESAPFAFAFEQLLAPGNSYFDLNNRVSALQLTALRNGLSVMSGTFMQRATNACRAALLTRSTT